MKKKSKSIPPLLSCSNDILRRAVVAIRDSRGIDFLNLVYEGVKIKRELTFTLKCVIILM